jgi:hypothetical protein
MLMFAVIGVLFSGITVFAQAQLKRATMRVQ